MSLKINTEQWKDIQLYPKYFDVVAGIYHYPDEYEIGDTPYISASNENNGVQQFINLKPDFEGNCIITGKVGCTAFYQSEAFCATSDVNIFKPKFKLSKEIGLFLSNIINYNENYRWSYGRQCRIGNSKKMKLKLPIDKNGEPDWIFMENYIKSLHHKSITTNNKPGKYDLNENSRKEFKIISLFSIERGNITSLNDIEEGDIPIVSASGENEGIAFYSNIPPKYSNKITVSMNGVNTGFTSYHGYDFNINVDACVLKEKFLLNKYIGLFIATIINNLRYKYSYGRKMSAERLQQEIIKLPVDDSGNPDRKFMENYIKNLPYGDRI